MHLGTNSERNTKDHRDKRAHLALVLAALADGPKQLGELAEMLNDDPKLATIEDLLDEAANLGFVARDEADDTWAIIARSIPFKRHEDAARRLNVGASSVSRWIAEGIMCRPVAVYVADGGLHTFPVPGPLTSHTAFKPALVTPQASAPPASVPTASAAPAPVHPSRPPAPTQPAAPVAPVVELPLDQAARLALDLGDHPAARPLTLRVLERVARGAA